MIWRVIFVKYQRFAEDERIHRRTVSDAVEVLRTLPGFDESATATVWLSALPLPSGQLPYLVDVKYLDPVSSVACCVSLPTSDGFTARRADGRKSRYPIERLEGASVNFDAQVTLSNGDSLRNVEMITAHMPPEPTARQRRIIHHAVIRGGKQVECTQDLAEGLPPYLRIGLPDMRVVDYSKLNCLNAPLLKQIKGDLEDHDPEFAGTSLQTIANTLRDVGARIPVKRPRRRRHDLPRFE